MGIPDRAGFLEMLRRRLKPRRFLHTLGVESVAVCLAARWGVPKAAASAAALLHDMTKDDPDQLKLLRECGIVSDTWRQTVPPLYHALTGAALAESLRVSPEIVAAVRWHPIGRPGMPLLERVLCVADLTEPIRQNYPALQEIRSLQYVDLNRALLCGLRAKQAYVRQTQRQEDPAAAETLAWLETLI